MCRARAAALFRGDRDLAHVLPAIDDLGGCGRSRLCRARSYRRLRADRDRHGRRRKAVAGERPRQLIRAIALAHDGSWRHRPALEHTEDQLVVPRVYRDTPAFPESPPKPDMRRNARTDQNDPKQTFPRNSSAKIVRNCWIV